MIFADITVGVPISVYWFSIHGQPHLGERSKQRVADLTSCDDVLTVQFPGDHVGDQSVADRDQIQSR